MVPREQHPYLALNFAPPGCWHLLEQSFFFVVGPPGRGGLKDIYVFHFLQVLSTLCTTWQIAVFNDVVENGRVPVVRP